MIKFFRKIRQQLLSENKVPKYLMYAIGEIVLVVIGILIALQINNWNQKENEQSKIKEYTISLIQDLERDIAMANQIIGQNEEIVDRIDSLNIYIQNRKIADFDNLVMLFYTLNKPHRPYVWSRTTITELKNSGSLGLIQNDSLSKMISEYDAFTFHLDDDFINDRTQFEKATALSLSVVNHNYPNFYEISENFVPNNKERDPSLFKSRVYLEAQAINLGIITRDIAVIQEMGNNYNILLMYLRIRIDVELPRLTKNAKEIIKLLKATYLN
ncbi:MAG: DUF6090 family protein [Eudoraea sp.]|uniref:DUF6090 family protein n=1 Tax=Eudoraea sp. TaxID=1979955 RepID=UPI003264E10E